jgi:hypothetical protein
MINNVGTKPAIKHMASYHNHVKNAHIERKISVEREAAVFYSDRSDSVEISNRTDTATTRVFDEKPDSMWDMMSFESIRAESEEQDQAGSPPDETHRLTRMLVAARSQFEVLDVISAATKNLLSMQIAAAQGDEKAAAIVKRLNRLISRGHRKMRDLSKEESMRIKQARAEKNEQRQLEEQIRLELRRAELERKQREKKYLHDVDRDDDNAIRISGQSLAATEAKIRALAQQMALLSMASGGVSSAGLDGSAATSADGSESASISGTGEESAE